MIVVLAAISAMVQAWAALHAGAVVSTPSLTVPVLMYHHIREPGPGLSTADTLRFAVSPAEFEKQLDYLKAQGYTTIDTRTLDRAMRSGHPLPRKPVILTFDDGWETQYDVVFPMLRERGMVGVFFVHTGVLRNDEGAGSAMSWSEVCEMEDEGMDIESHTLSHPSLPQIAPEQLEKELAESRRTLEAQLGRPVTAMAYPFGDFTEREIEATEKAGYRLAFTTEVGLAQNVREPLEVHRTIITYFDTLSDFEIKLNELDGGRAMIDYRPSITPPRVARAAAPSNVQ